MGAENLCHQAILMNHAAGAVAPLNPDLIEAGGAIGWRALRRGVVEGSVGPVGGAEVFVPARRTVIRGRWFPARVGSSSSRRPVPVRRSRTEFLRGAWTAGRRILVPAARQASPDAAVQLASRPCIPNVTRVRASARSIRRFRACGLTQAGAGCCVAPRIGTRRERCPVAARTQTLAPVRRSAVNKSSARIPGAGDRRNPAQPGPSRRRAGPGALQNLPDRGRGPRDAQPRQPARVRR